MTNPPRILVVAGEASGDTHAAELVAALRARRPDLTFFGMGGARLAAQGVELLFDAREVSVMGITEVLPRIPRILQILKGLAEAAAERRPDVAILVDIPDFNLRLAKKLKALGIPVAYYVSPMIWAWRRGRVRTIKRLVDRMLCILPFEEDFYREAGVSARYVGSPVVEQVPSPDTATAFRERLGLAKDAPTLALLPGSRMGEIRRLLPDMVGAAKRLSAERPGLQVVVPVAPTIDREEITSRFEGSGVTPILVEGRAPEVVGASDAAVVASGTAVLEAGLMQRPLVVVYRVSLITYWVGRLMLKVAFVSLINLLAGRRVVPELLQGEMTPERIAEEVRRVWIPGAPREEMIQGLAEMRGRLGETGAATRAAESVLELLPPGRV
ncbi:MULTISPECIES: lipid-A-disaccharide synthase [Myxococcus]|uniref:Lipid-A-disaccharide synthase n=1 Tax=Myxococcus xanthus TaxID=34 RepID=A0AAE6G2P4_MYXXA|nr:MULTISPECIES: lipid-A-disaccharide synthase [Myxococcus]QDE69677.1 lipid-A-disaccharide synthase [Myxococcus xanthus]QDE76955.1 lipid-A-disaccharide synthase [Myxococcus xanthus]QDF06215.1 lipid-A-disaccharide synthase [Myxococcus xanthus]WAM23685.1 lipid-A-disaccharide synthase [Myxococcus sp. NMCA1]